MLLPAMRVSGSGSYAPQPTHSGPEYQSQRQDSTTMVVDRERYHLGQKIYTGKFKLNSDKITEKRIKRQTKLLNRLKSGLPEEVAKGFDVKRLAGKLNNMQFWSLKYYLDVRYVYPLKS